MREAIFFDYNLKDIRQKFIWCLNNKQKVAEIAENGYQRTLQAHTTQKRAEYILACIGAKHDENGII